MHLVPRELRRSDRPSATAEWTTVARAAELHRPPSERIVNDEFAPYFLTPPGRLLLRTMRLTEGHDVGGITTSTLCRHRCIDALLERQLEDGVEQVLLLGAGYESRAYRFADQLRGRPVHEVDLRAISRRKAAIVAQHPLLFGHNRVRRVEIDFRSESLAERLLGAGFAVGARTFVAWEGVSMYLDRPTVEATIAVLHDVCGSGSTLAMDFWQRPDGSSPVALARRLAVRSFALIGEALSFSIEPDDVAKVLGSHGFSVVTVHSADDLIAGYATQERTGDGRTYVVAARRR